MTEKELVNENFYKISVLDAESDNGYDYYYYQVDICEGLSLRSVDSLDVKDNHWYLVCDDIPNVRINTLYEYLSFKDNIINLIN